jgi:hypothetical protein
MELIRIWIFNKEKIKKFCLNYRSQIKKVNKIVKKLLEYQIVYILMILRSNLDNNIVRRKYNLNQQI